MAARGKGLRKGDEVKLWRCHQRGAPIRGKVQREEEGQRPLKDKQKSTGGGLGCDSSTRYSIPDTLGFW